MHSSDTRGTEFLSAVQKTRPSTGRSTFAWMAFQIWWPSGSRFIGWSERPLPPSPLDRPILTIISLHQPVRSSATSSPKRVLPTTQDALQDTSHTLHGIQHPDTSITSHGDSKHGHPQTGPYVQFIVLRAVIRLIDTFPLLVVVIAVDAISFGLGSSRIIYCEDD